MGVHILHDFYDVAHALSFEEAAKDIALCGRDRTPDRKGQHGTASRELTTNDGKVVVNGRDDGQGRVT